MLDVQIDKITGVLFDRSELKISRHKPLLFAWKVTSYGENVGTDDGINVGMVEGDNEFDGLDDNEGDGVGHALPKRFDDSLEPKSPPSITVKPL